MTNASGNRRGFCVQVSALPDNERLIFKLIFSVSQKTRSREFRYEMASDENNAEVDIVIVENTEPTSLVTANGTGGECKVVYLANKSDDALDKNIIRRPLIATRVLSILDKVASEIESSTTEQVELTAATTETETTSHQESASEPTTASDQASDQVSEGAGSIEFSISEEEACELAIVHDETLSNPANNEDPKLAGIAATDDSSTSRFTTTTTVTAFPGSGVVLTQQQPIVDETSTSEPEPTQAPRALVVDDSASVRKQLELELELFNVSVDYAENGESAMKLRTEHNYDLAFLDVVLPDIDGFQICKHIKSETPDMKVIMLTGKATQADKIKGKLAGCDDYLVKPVGRNTFQATVKNYLDQVAASENLEAKSI